MNSDYAATAPNKLSRMPVCRYSMDFPLFKARNRSGTALNAFDTDAAPLTSPCNISTWGKPSKISRSSTPSSLPMLRWPLPVFHLLPDNPAVAIPGFHVRSFLHDHAHPNSMGNISFSLLYGRYITTIFQFESLP